ncbi:N-acetyltransferase [Sphingomonas sp. BIUV-7]|uniref:N-acetyltransferase n=1 Tax=Sphingomonas natans TaxID=3063330 RepID=A0ABT8Y903_9SPHN|nr:N-acetyltransferase [Sphingomonas sp. BIUV-7]MDO6414811.1 N-acetyltransferase [Sphingomonas sp. BIUV-7]
MDHAPALADFTIAPLRSAAASDVDALLDRVFGPDRRRRTAYRIRDGMTAIVDLSFAAFDRGGTLIGSLQCWPAALDGDVPVILVGPVAVEPALQREGIGRKMMERMIAAADYLQSEPLVLIGDPEYYGRFFGFEAHWTREWTVPGPVERRRLLARVPAGMTLPADGHLGPRR